jgi:hypothetical protein
MIQPLVYERFSHVAELYIRDALDLKVSEQGGKEVHVTSAFDLGVDGMDVEPIRPQLR